MTVITEPAMASVNSKCHTESLGNRSSERHIKERTVGEKCIPDNSVNNDVLSYAEVLYKCTLCRSLPSILTNEENFRVHMRAQHLPLKDGRSRGETCGGCKLRFKTKEDFQFHAVSAHPGVYLLSENSNSVERKSAKEVSPEKEASDIAAFPVTRQPSVGVLAGPKAVSTSNVALTSSNATDVKPKLTELTNACSEALNLKANRINSPSNDHSSSSKSGGFKPDYFQLDKTKQTSSDSLCRLQALTDQIVASSRSVTEKHSAGGDIRDGEIMRPLPTPGFTQEFGKYTKLVREGGNIVYFCQICNWKSPSKPDFQAHCSGLAHRAKFRVVTKSGNDCCELSAVQSKGRSSVAGEKTIGMKSVRKPKEMLLGIYSPINVIQTPAYDSHGGLMEDLNADISDPNGRPLNLADCPRSQVSMDVNGAEVRKTGAAERGEVNETQDILPEDKILVQYPNSSVQLPEHPSIVVPARRRRKRPAPVMVRNQAKDGKFDWSDCSSSTGSDCDESTMEADMTKRLKHAALNNVDRPSNFDVVRPIAVKITEIDSGSEESIHGTESSQLYIHMRNKINQRASPSGGNSDAARLVSKNDNSNTSNVECDLSVKQEPDLEVRSMLHSESHQERQHDENGTDSGDNVENDGMRGNNGEGWKILRIKEVLSEILCESSKANIPRDLLLQKVSHLLQCPEVAHWGPACNRAVREEYPNSIAQRKGKFKKTYFFGVQFIEQTTDLGHMTEAEAFSFQPLRDMSLDTEKILQYLPDLVCWTGDLESGVSRDELLQLLAEPIADSNVLVWGIECNRAVRKLYPEVHTKRKGKYKTVFYGLSYLPHVRQERLTQNFLKTRSGNFTEESAISLTCYTQDRDVFGISPKNAQFRQEGKREPAQRETSEGGPPSPMDLKVSVPEERQ